MTDMIYAPLFAELDAEREVVLEEIAMYEDTPQELVHDLLSEAVFGGHPLGRPVIGTADVISSVTRRSIASYHRSMFVPGNIVLGSAGNVDHERLVTLLAAAEAKQADPDPDAPRALPLVKAPPPGVRFARKDTEQYHVCVAAPGIARSDRRRFAASLLDAILGGSASSRLFQEIRENRGMAYAVYSFASQYTDTGSSAITSARVRKTSPPASRSRPPRSPASPTATCARTSWSGRRRTSRAGSCSRWRRRRTG